MVELEGIILRALENIFNQNPEIARLACQQRSKFEGWLKFELAGALINQSGFARICLEDNYDSNGRSDISLEFHGQKWHIEMKTANANWRIEGVESKTRPITRNMQSIVEDIDVLKQKSKPFRGMAVFCIFPVPERIWKSRIELNNHLQKIEKACDFAEETLIRSANYIQVTSTFGICAFSVAVS